MGGLLLLLFGALAIGALAPGDSGDDDLTRTQGTDGDDTILGSDGDDVVYSGDGDDLVYGMDGDDYVRGGAGDDAIIDDQDDATESASGNDTFYGGAGDDFIAVNDGFDVLLGGTGGDYLVSVDDFGTETPDTLSGGYGNDYLLGHDGDVMDGGEGYDAFGVEYFGDDETPVEILDYETGEVIEVFNYDPTLLLNDGSDVVEVVDLGDYASVQANGVELVRVLGNAGAYITVDLYDYSGDAATA
ncbi:calcium-binding protein [Tropicibacter naphthalenivorans]|uniref:Hemolysin IA n=1 Tax=Tropicibacter naphthalenivorans TaxID=441103 RepID=A0A0P1G4F5_9RHOB|nr:calcium-binding protein [Tropicibacter naphthalenivorans]CUH76688.1 Hemolysin IA [Tropicibacter naphthalenivorans]SMC64062.1 Hemolysin-type calcium-binding repeat-containing protein [Tropicibacter naphthalenivorans]